MASNKKHTADTKPYYYTSSSAEAKKSAAKPDQLSLHELQLKAKQIERNYPRGYQGL
jgi:hypothetical protein